MRTILSKTLVSALERVPTGADVITLVRIKKGLWKLEWRYT